MLVLMVKFILLFILCSISISLFKACVYTAGKKLIDRNAEGSALNWTCSVFIKNGVAMTGDDCFIMAVSAALLAIYI